jgi:hypothetical protein
MIESGFKIHIKLTMFDFIKRNAASYIDSGTEAQFIRPSMVSSMSQGLQKRPFGKVHQNQRYQGSP